MYNTIYNRLHTIICICIFGSIENISLIYIKNIIGPIIVP